MIAKQTFWFQRILFLFLFTFSSVSFQQKVSKDNDIQEITSSQIAEKTQQTYFQTNLSQKKNDVFSAANRRTGAGIRISENFEENSQKDFLSLSFCTDYFNYNAFLIKNTFHKYFRFSFYAHFSVPTRLYSYICCWRI